MVGILAAGLSLTATSGQGPREPHGGIGVSWYGDIPRDALEALPNQQSAQAGSAAFLLGWISEPGQWQRVADLMQRSPFGGESWHPAVDWRRQALVYVAYDGATQRLELAAAGVGSDGIYEISFVAHPSRRPEGPAGPCSALFQVVERSLSEVRVRSRLPHGDATVGVIELVEP
jgi:hypothetical protein